MKTVRLFVLMTLTLSMTACGSKETAEVTAGADSLQTELGTRPVTAEKLNLNTATKEEFMTIPGVGERMAREFDEYRPYASIVQFRNEMGKYVDEATIAGYEDHVYVPIDINASDAETVAQILGLDLAGAEQLVAMRPFADREAFVAAVTEVAGGISSQFSRLYLAE
ncbi:MAG: helix-hairpin-helix domain-containing protein [Bacteroidetes bacterium]|nr:helix-hairpin-helix domain-containing protein [Bacteroidota bacterium]MDA0873772.1 helix-hairpin-helix domain-containing protein [Bacteroidota bacterium]